MPDDEREFDTDENDQLSFHEAVGMARAGAAFARSEVEQEFWDEIDGLSTLVDDEAAPHLQFLKERGKDGEKVVAALEPMIQAERESRDRVAAAQADTERDDLMSKARNKLAAERQKSAKAAEMARAIAAVREEEAAAAAVTNPLADPLADAEQMVARAVDVVDDPNVDLETKAAAAREAIAAFGAAQPGSKLNPIDVDPEEFLAQFNERQE